MEWRAIIMASLSDRSRPRDKDISGMNPDFITIGIVDADDGVRTSLSRLVRSVWWRVESFVSADDFMQRIHSCHIDCLVMALRVPGKDGLELHQWMLAQGHNIPFVFLTAYGSVETSVQAMKQGAEDFLLKPTDDEILLESIRQAIHHHVMVASKEREVEEIRARYASLTAREQEVTHLVAIGFLNKQIAADLGIALKTVKVHRARALEKMGVRSVAKLVQRCVKAGIILEQDLPKYEPTSRRGFGR
jgi:FixJ family two-component response regulator